MDRLGVRASATDARVNTRHAEENQDTMSTPIELWRTQVDPCRARILVLAAYADSVCESHVAGFELRFSGSQVSGFGFRVLGVLWGYNLM